jgi:hypothetical protein
MSSPLISYRNYIELVESDFMLIGIRTPGLFLIGIIKRTFLIEDKAYNFY